MLLALLLAASAVEPLRLDAGPVGGPVLEGFDRLDQEASEDPRARWVRPPAAAFRDDQPDPLALDGLEGGTLHLDLEPGRWILAALLGRPDERAVAWLGMDAFGLNVDGRPAARVVVPDAWPEVLASPLYTPNPRPVFTPEQQAWDRQIGPAWPWVEATVEVQAGGIDLAAVGRPLMALVAWPASEPEAWEVEQTLIGARRRVWWARHVVGEAAHVPAPQAPPGALTLEAGALDALPDARRAAPASRHGLHLARADRASLLLYVHGGDGPGAWSVDAPAGLVVDVAEATWLDTAQTPGRAWGPRPVVLEEGVGWRGGQGVPPALLLTVRSTATTPTGRHRVRIDLARDGARARLDLDVRVHAPVVERSLPVGLFVQVDPAAVLRTGGASDTVTALLDEHLALLASRGFDALSLRYLYWPDRYPRDEHVHAEPFLHAVATWASLGGTSVVWADPKIAWRPAAFVHDDGPVLPAHLEASARGLLAATSEAALPVYVHAWEEEATWKNLAAVPRGEALAARLRALGPPGLRLFGTLPAAPDWPMAASLDRVVVWGAGADLVEAVAAARRAGAEAWAYNLTPGASSPLLAWAAGAEGLLQWHASPMAADPYRFAADPSATFHTILGPDGRHHATVLLEDLADGAADARLLATLEAGGAADLDPRLAAILAATRASLLGARRLEGGDGALIPAAARRSLRAAVLRGR